MEEKDEKVELRSEIVQDVLSGIPNRIIKWGNFIAFIILFISLIIAYAVKIPKIVSSQITISSINPPQKIFAKNNGILKHCFVKEGEKVVSNQILAIFDNSASYKDVYELSKKIEALNIENDEITFQIDNNQLKLGTLQSSYSNFEKAYLNYKINNELRPLDLDIINQNKELHQLQDRKKITLQQIDLIVNENNLKQKEQKRFTTLFEKGVISAQEYENKKQEYYRFLNTHKQLLSQLSEIESRINDIKNQTNKTEINQLSQNQDLKTNLIQAFNQLKKDIIEWEQLFVLKSSINGILTSHKIWNENQTIQNNELLFTIVPLKQKQFVGKMQIPMSKFKEIKKHQKVQIKLFIYPYNEYGYLKGYVKTISLAPDLQDNYTTIINIPEKTITSYNKSIKLKSEMIGTADIVTQENSLLHLFFDFIK